MFLEKFGAIFYNWMTSWRVNDGYSNGIKHPYEDDGGHPAYIDVNSSSLKLKIEKIMKFFI